MSNQTLPALAPVLVWGGRPDDEEAAAAMVAVACFIAEQETRNEEAPAVSQWRSSAALLLEGMRPTRLPVTPGWGRVERLRRTGRGGSGIVGS